jgi:error-prone DNA polymerase
VGEGDSAPPYVELHCHSNYSFLDGASFPEELVARAREVGMEALALTDHDGLYGAVRFWKASQRQGVKPIIGVEMEVEGEGHLVLLAEDKTGYTSLCRLISRAQLAGGKAHSILTLEDLARQRGGLICLSGCCLGPLVRRILAGDHSGAEEAAGRLLDIFGPENLWVEVSRRCLLPDRYLVGELATLAERIGAGVVATGNVHYACREKHRLHDLLTCIRHHTTLDEAGSLLDTNSECYLKSPAQMASLFADLPQAVANTRLIAERCHLELDLSAHRLPRLDLPPGETPSNLLHCLCQEGLHRRYRRMRGEDGLTIARAIPERARRQLEHELSVIEAAGLAGYFLIVWDILRFARERGIPAQGRGSAAGSLVAYLLGITRVDPLQHDLLFERFLSTDSHIMPDIDVDFGHRGRDEVIEYVYSKYGPEHTAMVCNVVTYQPRLSRREVAKALGIPAGLLNQWLHLYKESESEASESEWQDSAANASSKFALFSELVDAIQDFPRHLSIHVGGMLITGPPLIDVVPIERATMPGRVVSQWNKDGIEDLGLIKLDLLSLRTLSMIQEAVELIRQHRGVELDLEEIPLDDPVVYRLLQAGDTVGCFQVESRAQIQILPRMKPRRFEDLVVEVALIRPGPIQGGMVRPYFKRRQGLEPVTYLHPLLAPILSETLGVVVFQEQVIRIAMAMAGFSAGEADMLRRAMSRSRSQEAMEDLRERFVRGAVQQGLASDLAQTIFEKLRGFASYGFCKSHAAAFARTAYESCYLKAYYPAEFYCAILNNQPMGFYSPAVIVGDARRHGVGVLPPHVDHSRKLCTLEGGRIRLGFSYVKGLGEVAIERLEEAQTRGAFPSLREFCHRTRLPRRAVKHLIRVGAMDHWQIPRRNLLWEVGKISYAEELDLALPPDEIRFPTPSRAEELVEKYELLGLSPDDHPLALYRPWLEEEGVLSSGELIHHPDGVWVQVAGLAVVRQRPPTAKGFVFLTLEDEEGLLNVIIRPDVYQQQRAVVEGTALLLVGGRLQRQGGVINVVAQHIGPLPPLPHSAGLGPLRRSIGSRR